jgi:hypothetical protein
MPSAAALSTACNDNVEIANAAQWEEFGRLNGQCQLAAQGAEELAAAFDQASETLERHRRTCLSIVQVCEMCEAAIETGDLHMMRAVRDIARLRFDAILAGNPTKARPRTAEVIPLPDRLHD